MTSSVAPIGPPARSGEPQALRFARHLVLIRGGGDLATGVAYRLHHAGFPVAVTEIARPLTVRRKVSLSSAVGEGEVAVESLRGRLVAFDEAANVAGTGVIPVLVSPAMPDLGQAVVVDARLAKRNLDTALTDAPLVVALGPGFTARIDCHAVIETKRGHRLGRVIWEGPAAPDTGTPGIVAGHGRERVLRAPQHGTVRWDRSIGDSVTAGQSLGWVDGPGGPLSVSAPFEGVVRGLIAAGTAVASGLKIGDVDPRDDASAAYTISDKALAVGGGVLEAIFVWLR